MKTAKRILALALVCLMVLSLTACHKKGEIAVKINDYEFTSGYYACALVFADTEARAIVEENLDEDEDATDIDYYKHKVEDTDYVKWVEDTALTNLKAIAAYKENCEQNKLELEDETVELARSNAEYLWDSYGYGLLLEPNGVSKQTFIDYNTDSYYADLYFDFLYGAEGVKAIAAEEVSRELTDNYVLVNMIEVSFSEMADSQKTEAREKIVGYETALKSGSKTFEEIYLEHNDLSADEHTHDKAEEGELEPQDHHATVLGNEDTDYASDYFEDAKEMKMGEVKLITLEEDAGLVLLVKKDIAADPYYLDVLDTTLRNALKGEEFYEDAAEYAEKMKTTVKKSAVKQFKVKKIEYPEGY